MKIQLMAPWHSMDEMPEFGKDIVVMSYQKVDLKLNSRWNYVVDADDWLSVVNCISSKGDCTVFAWCYLIDLAAMEFSRMVVKEASQDAPSIRYVGAGGSGYGRTGFGSAGGGGTSYSLMGGSGSGGSSHGSSFSSVGGLTESHDWQSFKVKLTEVV